MEKKKVLTSIIYFANTVCVFLISIVLFANTGLIRQETFENAIRENDLDAYFYKDWDYILENELMGDSHERLQGIMLKAFGKVYHEEWLKQTLIDTSSDIISIASGKQRSFENILDFSEKKGLYEKELASLLEKEDRENLNVWLYYPEDIHKSAAFLSEHWVKIPDELNLQQLAGEKTVESFANTAKSVNRTLAISGISAGIVLLLTVIFSAFLFGFRFAFKTTGFSIIAGGTIFMVTALILSFYLRSVMGSLLILELEFLKPVSNNIITGYMFSALYIWVIAVASGAALAFAAKLFKFKMSIAAIILSLIAPVFLSACTKTADCCDEMQGGEEKYMQIYSVNVTPHVSSGEIPSYNRKDPFVYSEDKGALIRIFVKNVSEDISFGGKVLFNGKTGERLLEENIVSWCSVPGVRSQAGLSSNIPPGGMDSYILNVIDSSFYKNGITVTMEYDDHDLSLSLHTEILEPGFFSERIIFTSSNQDKVADGLIAYFRNNSDEDITVGNLEIFTAPEYYSVHWWRDKIYASPVHGEKKTIPPGGFDYVQFSFDRLPHGDSILAFEIPSKSGNSNLLYQIKPLVMDFDINLGWAGRDLASGRYFAKTATLMHFNTVHGDMHGYMGSDTWKEFPFKGFAVYENTNIFNLPENIKNIHGVEFLGEPQMSNADAQGIYNRYALYRLSGYPTTLTLTHEPGYFVYAGLADFPHFDAYRVIAPHADKWGEYKDYGEKNTLWGAPLETVGTYMRTLHEISMPMPVAAWTQGVAGGWFNVWRVTSPNPNKTEIRVQAYQKIANGALSLYWFNLSGTSAVRSRYALDEIRNINREIMTVEKLIMGSVPYSAENIFMDMDMNILAGTDYCILFALDLDYKVSPVNHFVIDYTRKETLEYLLPKHLDEPEGVVKVTANGLHDIDAVFNGGKVIFEDEFHTTGMYVVYNKGSGHREFLEERYNGLIEKELSIGFDPISVDSDFMKLKKQIMP